MVLFYSNWVENIVGKAKMLVTSIFSIPTLFSRGIFFMVVRLGLFGGRVNSLLVDKILDWSKLKVFD